VGMVCDLCRGQKAVCCHSIAGPRSCCCERCSELLCCICCLLPLQVTVVMLQYRLGAVHACICCWLSFTGVAQLW
jgi:hypothetical protein